MRLDARAETDLQSHLPRLLSRARARLKLPGNPESPETLSKPELKRAAQFISELHRGLVGDRSLAQAATYDRAALLGAYLLWWWPQSYARTRAALALAPLPFLLRKRAAPIRILDLGAGSGPAALAIADFLVEKHCKVDALLVDESELALDEARALAERRPNLSQQTMRIDLAKKPVLPSGKFELISAAHLLSEMPEGAKLRADFLREICEAHLAPDGALLLLEPALRETGRALLEVRDQLLARPSLPPLRALAPCFTQAPCPALQNPRDWCTAEVSWNAPPHLLQLSRELALHAEAPLSFAPLLLTPAIKAPPANVWRVVGVPPEEKGKKRLFICGSETRVAVARLDRDAREENRPFDDAARGDVLRFTGLAEKGDGLRMAAGATVEAVSLEPSAKEPSPA